MADVDPVDFNDGRFAVGEDSHFTGEEGVDRAKKWLLRSTRVINAYGHFEQAYRQLLVWRWPNGNGTTYSFDLGGVMAGDDLDGLPFLAEVKNHRTGNAFAGEFRKYLAQCYVRAQGQPANMQFLWIAWTGFGSTSWDDRCSQHAFEQAIVHTDNRERVTGMTDEVQARLAIDHAVLGSLSSRMWMVTLSMQQERLVPTLEHFQDIRARLALNEVTS